MSPTNADNTAVAPVLVIGYGNPARGDDGLGPLLADRLEDWLAKSGIKAVEVLVDFQLNVEHVLDLAGRNKVLLIDASTQGRAPFKCEAVRPFADATHTTHAVSPQGLLDTYCRLMDRAPPSVELLSVPGNAFELGAPMSEQTLRHAERAWQFLRDWCERAVQAGAVGHA
ncbi:hydrogenase maturation protease [Niveibacterium sp. SC-1]|uniref:hydrogenase maturation protease n=1 Tax=Niveibacterium sp. SC-1 TaxID=3135646 RepID=UPI00311DFC47